jgi:hypothetical protein
VGKVTPYRPPINDEYYRLLAYVKWSVDENLNFKRKVCPMINSALYPTYKGVHDKLYREWKNTYLNGWGKFNYLFDFGLEVLALVMMSWPRSTSFTRRFSWVSTKTKTQKPLMAKSTRTNK